MILIGELAVWVALVMAAWAAIVSFLGGATGRAELVASGRRGVYATLLFVVLASLGLWTALLTHDFSVRHVAFFTSANLPHAHVVTALWAGPAGSLLLWLQLLAGCSVAAVYMNRVRGWAPMPYVTAVLAMVMVFSLAALALGANPFERLEWVPLDGRGMNPQLQSPGMALHPPILYLGYAAMTVPFAFTVAALSARRHTADWLAVDWLAPVRWWMLVAWLFTTAGILTGMWWAYMEPGRDAYWARDPVASAALLPWTVTTAFLLSVTVREKRGVSALWGAGLVVGAFLSAIAAMFLSGGGIISSVHAFAESAVAVWFTGFLIVLAAAAAILVGIRLGEPAAREHPGLPVAGKRRRYGGYAACGGAILLVAAFAGLSFSSAHEVTLRTGDAAELRDPYGRSWRIVSEGVSRYDMLNRQVTAIALAVYRGDARQGLLISEERQHFDSRGAPTFEPSIEAGILRSPLQDVYAALVGVAGEDTALVRVGFNPLVWCLWLGGALLILGGLFVAWPPQEPARIPAPAE